MIRKCFLISLFIVVFSVVAFSQAKWRQLDVNGVVPPPRCGHALVFDSSQQRLELVGGHHPNSGHIYDDLWEFDTKKLKWNKKGKGGNTTLLAHSYNADQNRSYFMGGVYLWGNGNQTDGMNRSTFFVSDGSLFHLGTQIPSVIGIYHHAMAYDRARKQMVMFGGQIGYTTKPYGGAYIRKISDFTFVLGKGDWARKITNHYPTERFGHVMVWDSRTKEVLMHGGILDEYDTISKVLFAYNGKDWRILSTGGPYRTYHAAAYDEQRKVMVIFGGTKYGIIGYTRTDETWEWSGKGWRLIAPSAQTPSPRSSARMAYDSYNNVIWLFGGKQTSGALDSSLYYYSVDELGSGKLNIMSAVLKPGSEVAVGDKVKFIAKVKNISKAYKSDFTVEFYLSDDRVLEGFDILVARKKTRALLAPGKKIKINVNKAIGKNLEPGEYYVIAKVLWGNDLEYSSENYSRKKYTIGEAH